MHSAEFQTSTRIYRSSSETQGTGATTFLPFSRITIYSGLKAGFPILDRGLSEFYFSSWIFHRGLFARETRAAVAAVDLQNAIDWKPGRIVKIFARPRSGLENRRFDVVAASQQQRLTSFQLELSSIETRLKTWTSLSVSRDIRTIRDDFVLRVHQ